MIASADNINNSSIQRKYDLIALVCLLAISFVFGVKYIYRADIIVSLIISFSIHLIEGIFIYYIIYKWEDKFYPKLLDKNKNRYALIIISLIVVFIFIKDIDLLSIKVDRWSAVVYWWDAVFQNIYPYSTRTHHGGYHSPSPFLQLIFLPGYLFQDIGLINLFICGIFLFFLISKSSIGIFLTLSILFFSSLAVQWELMVRSSIIINYILLLVIIIQSDNKRISKPFYTLMLALCFGLMLSTRISVILGLAPLYLYLLRKHHFKLFNHLVTILGVATGFFVTYLPLIWHWGIGEVMSSNPIMHQNKHMPTLFTLFLIALSISSSFASKNINQLAFFLGIIYLLTGIIFDIYAIYITGFECGFIYGCGDISYINAAVPFFLYNISNIKTYKSHHA